MESENYRLLVNEAKLVGVWNAESINALLMTNSKAVERALTTIYAFQTAAEKESKMTIENNGVGFSGLDGEIFLSFAQRVLKGYTLSEKQIAVCRKQGKNGRCRLGRYWRQIETAIKVKAEHKVAA